MSKQNYQFHIPKFKIRCSGIGAIMTEPKGKSVRQRLADMEAEIQEKSGKLAELLEATRKAKQAKVADYEAQQKAKTESITPETKEAAAEKIRASIAALEEKKQKVLQESDYTKTAQKLEDQVKALKEKYQELLPNIDAPNLSQTCITFLQNWVNGYVYQRRIEVVTKYTYKGNEVENDAIMFASGWIPEMGLSAKNEEHFENEYFKGTPDVIGEDYIFDAKSSWSHDTFPLYSPELPETDYDWQVLGYMDLTGKTKGRVVFVLMSMPEEIIEKEARWKLGADYSREDYLEFAKNYQYDDLPAYLRIKEYEVAYDPEKLEAVKKRVLECRDYIENTILPSLERNAKKYQEND